MLINQSAFRKRMNYLRKYFSVSKSDILFFLTALAVGSFSGSIVESIFNNFLNESFHLSNVQRSVIEFPRELPGLIIMLVIAGLSFLCSRKLATFAMLLASVGLLLIGACSVTLTMMLVWLFIFSMGQHLLIPLQSSIGMELAKEGQTGRRLGQINAVRSLFDSSKLPIIGCVIAPAIVPPRKVSCSMMATFKPC